MKKQKIYFLLVLGILIFSCDKVTDSTPSGPITETPDNPELPQGPDELPPSNNGWLVPVNEVFDGGPGKDGIPALTNPEFITADQVNYLGLNDVVIIVSFGGEIKVYPHNILDWHEIINDDVGGYKLSVTYCPLTGSGIAWNRVINGVETTFGVSGLLYNTNLIAYDRETDSNWSQMMQKSINGERIGMEVVQYPYQIVETSWGTLLGMYPNAKVVSSNTGYARDYTVYPYNDYKTNHSSLIFPVNNNDNRLPRKKRVIGIIVSQNKKAYSISSFLDSPTVINENVGGEPVIIAGSTELNYAVAFYRRLGGETLEFQPIENSLPLIFKDNEGNKWDLWGVAVEGPRAGARLNRVKNYISYWFAWAAFFPETDLYQ